MAHVGQTIAHPITGERMTFLETATSSSGSIPDLHVHPGSEKQLSVTRGRLRVRRGKSSWVAKAVETVVIPVGNPHLWSNPFDEPAAVIFDL